MPRVSILMSTYAAEKPANLEASLSSLCTQTVAPHQIVLVIDGPIGREQERIIQRFSVEGIGCLAVYGPPPSGEPRPCQCHE